MSHPKKALSLFTAPCSIGQRGAVQFIHKYHLQKQQISVPQTCKHRALLVWVRQLQAGSSVH